MKRSKYCGAKICSKTIWYRQGRPELIVIDKKEQKGIVIDIAVPVNVRVDKIEKEEESEKVAEFEKRDQKIVEIEKCRNKCFCRIW